MSVMKRDRKLQIAWGRAVRKLRVAAGISQERLAELSGLNRSYIGDVERGERNVGLSNMGRLAGALGKTLSEVVSVMEGYSRAS